MNSSVRFDAFALLVIVLMSIAVGLAAGDAGRVRPGAQVVATAAGAGPALQRR